MKKILKYFLLLIAVAAIAAFFYWEKNKHRIIKDTIGDAIKKKTDSLYYIHYDSSRVDEITGDASFYNVSLQSDSAKKQLLESTDSLPNAIYFINVAEVKVTGVDIPGLLQNQYITAHEILLNKPVIQIVNTGSDKPRPFTHSDTLQLYEKILGKFKSIKTDNIRIQNGTLLMTSRSGKPLTTIEKINVDLANFLVDSEHNYQDIISYFIRDITLSVENIQLPESANGRRINITGLVYDATKKILQIKEVQQYKTGNMNPLIDLRNINITQLNTDDFILYHKLNAGMVACGGGLVTIYKRSPTETKAGREIELASDIISQVKLHGMKLENTRILVEDPANPSAEPFILDDVRFIIPETVSVSNGDSLFDIISNTKWKLSSSGFSFMTKDKRYRIKADALEADNSKSTATVKSILVQPLLSEQQFAKSISLQEDRYDFKFNNIQLNEVDFKKLITENVLEAGSGSVQPILKIFNDRTVEPNPRSKVGKYPNQLLVKMNFPLYIKRLAVNNGMIAYKEKGRKSGMEGSVFFTNLNGIIENVTNMSGHIKNNPVMTVNANALFLGAGKISTVWVLPLSAGNETFTAKGELGEMDAKKLNQLIEPLAMASVKDGDINKITFNLKGNDYKATGDVLFLYNDLKIELLKKEQDELKTKDVASLLANAIVKNSNTADDPRKSDIDHERELNRSFFNLLWKSIFSGAKKIALGKKN